MVIVSTRKTIERMGDIFDDWDGGLVGGVMVVL